MRGNKKVRWGYRLLPVVLGVFLLAGMFGLLAPAPALAAGGSLTIEGPGLAIQDPDGDGTPGVTITQYQLRGTEALPSDLQSVTGWVYLPQHDEWYSTINTWPTKNWYRGQGVKLTDLLKLAGGLKPEATLIRFTSSDGFKATFTVQELLNEPRYRFPNFIDYSLPAPDRYFGHIPGDPSDAVQVEAIIAHRSYSTQNIEDILGEEADGNFSRADANHLLYGQRAVTQQTNARFAKFVTKIEVLTDEVPKWDNPTASVPPGEVPAGTLVELHSPYDDEDKVQYTLDGSDPTIHSPMYNWIASRWWSSREDVLDEINKPIEITQNTTIKAFVTGPGRADSDIVTFEYTVPTVAVTGVSIVEGDQVELEVGLTKQLTAVVEPENATNKNVTWASSNEAVATVNATGLVTAVSAGTATITVTTQDGNFTDSITVTVLEERPYIVSITEMDDVQVPYGTPEADAIAALAPETTIVDSDGAIHTVTLNWTIADYDGNTPGDYTATGTFELPAGVKQSDPPMDLKVTATVTVLPQPTYPVTLAVEPAGGGTVTGAGEYPAGASVTVEAQAAEGYTFVNWTDAEGKEVSAAASYTFTMGTQPVTLTANFRLLEVSQYAFDYEVPAEIVEGQDVEVAVTFASVEVKDLGYDGVIFRFGAAGAGDVTFTAEDSNGVVHTFTNEGYWGPSVGFDLPAEYSATTDWMLKFAQAGTYTITFSLIDADTEAVIAGVTDSITVNVVPPAVAPTAAFTADPTSGTAPLTVSFTDESTGTAPLTYVWDFNNDSVVDSTYQNPTFTYDAAGTYSVKLTVTNAAGSDDEVKTGYITVSGAEPPAMDVLYDGTVTLTPGETFTVSAYNSSVTYTVYETTPLGALQAAATAGGFTYDVTDKNYSSSGALLLDNVGTYDRKAPGYWYAYVNDVYKDGYNNPAGALNLIELVDGDKVEFYYAAGIADPTDLNAVKAAAIAAVKTIASITGSGGGGTPADWTLQLSGAREETVTKAYFEEGLACQSSGHRATWTDGDGNVWGGVPLWLLVGMVDDDPDVGPYHFNFNDNLAAQHYEVNVISGDGWKATLDSADIARSDGYIVANTLNGELLPLQTESGKPCWPLHLKGSAVFGGQQVGNIVRIELSGLPQPSEGWTLEMLGDVGDTITQEEFEEGLACTDSGHYREWRDKDGNVWSGVSLWVLLGVVDDIETGSHWTFNDDVAADGYNVKVVAADGYSRTFDGRDVARSDDYIVANKCNGEPLTGSTWPLRLVGPGVAKEDGSLGGAAVGGIVKIEIPELQTPEAAPGSWNLTLKGKISDVISQAEFEAALACPNSGHLAEWTDKDGNVWSGIPLWLLAGWVDDRQPHDFDASQATAGYTILVKAGDGYTKDFTSTDVAWSSDYIIANKCNGAPLTDSWPLRLVGAGVAREDGSLSGTSVGNIVSIELTSFEAAQPIPQLRIVKYGEDGTTIIKEKTVDHLWLEKESGLDVIGDGKTVYRFEGVTFDPDNKWDPEETYPGGFKIANAVKGTRLRDLCELVGGMGAGTEVVLVARDGYETRLPYSSIYPDPAVQARQGDAILAWWADGKYVPDYKDGMRLFFTPDDGIYGQWDMHETLPEQYWHYYYSDGVQYPSCAGLSAKWITEIRVYSITQGDWMLKLDGRDVGGLHYVVSKTYFEQALACQFGANHKATYTDSEGRVWEGMPLWFLAGFVDDADQHSDNAFNDELAMAGYQVVITAADGYSVTIDSKDIIRNSNYIIANTLNGAPIPESDGDWPLRLVGPAVSGKTSISQIVSIKLVPVQSDKPQYNVVPAADDICIIGETQDGIKTMTVKPNQTGFKHFTVSIEPVTEHEGMETVVFVHLRNGEQLELNATVADFDEVAEANAGFNVRPGNVVKVFIADQLTNDPDHNPIILQ